MKNLDGSGMWCVDVKQTLYDFSDVLSYKGSHAKVVQQNPVQTSWFYATKHNFKLYKPQHLFLVVIKFL